MSARAGIVVTGTEVLTGRVQDRNGPWIADRLLELGVELAHITICGDRPGRHRGAAALSGRRGRGPDRHQRRSRADGRRHDGRNRGAVLRARTGAGRSSSRRRSPRSSSGCGRGSPRWTSMRCGRPTASRRWCPPVPTSSIRSVPRPASSFPASRRSSCCPGRRVSYSRCGSPRWKRPPCRRRSPAGRTTGRRRCGCSGCPSRALPSRCAKPKAVSRVSIGSRSPPACGAESSRSSRATSPRRHRYTPS